MRNIKMFENHSQMVSALAKDGKAIQDTMTPDKVHLMHMIMGVSGEVGELLDTVKKHIVYDKPLDIENVLEELGDIEFYLEGFRQGLRDGGHTTLGRDEILDMNMSKLSKRYHTGSFSNDQANDRADKNPTLSDDTKSRMTCNNALAENTAIAVGKLILQDLGDTSEAEKTWTDWVVKCAKENSLEFDTDYLYSVWNTEVWEND